ncbi:zinc-ribbon domain-containing protein [Butyrivibrio sp. NC2007]|uniref:zinc-ribbon domain-containing protein n=1 Tax=Butyrivibrio sp. NC2007 TaxID=1280683 RepID=UPI0003B54F34|nr:zinc-ribbon domain-containing protein [Butyrivibrio sp. NC2007]
MKCPSCGKVIVGDSMFCSYCGRPIKDDYKTRQQILRNKNEEQKQRRQEAADAMWSEVESRNNVRKPLQPKISYNKVAKKKSVTAAGNKSEIMSEVVTCPKCHTKYNMFLKKKTYLSFNTTCPICNKKWKKRYWGRIFITILFAIILYLGVFFYVANII